MSEVAHNKMAFSTVTSMKVDIQPIDDTKSGIADGVYGKTFVCYTDGNVSLFPGDRLREGNTFYTVRSGGVSRRQHGHITYGKVVIELTG